jgi:DNA-binding transcriptional LysR family regulator
MRIVHEFLKTAPFDIYELHLFHLVAEHRSFTKAAELAGLTQSAVTRQMQGIEESLGVALFERTTRSVHLTPAGQMLRSESGRLLGDVDQVLRRIREDFAGAKKVIRVAVSRSVGLAYLPGFFHANLRRLPQVGYRVSYDASGKILTALENNEADLGVFSPPSRMPDTLRVTHRFTDGFAIIASTHAARDSDFVSKAARLAWANRQNWLLLEESGNTGRRLRTWMKREGIVAEPGMTLDSFDLIINLVSLGMGVSCVPIRALALYARKRNIRRIVWPTRFTRELVVVVRRNREIPEHVGQFIANVLF